MNGWVLRTLFYISLLGLPQCYWSEPPPLDTLVYGLSSEPKTLDPRFATDANGQRIDGLIFSSLVKRDADLNLTGDLAESWEYKDNNFTFKIRPHIYFHDGAALTAEDLEFSVEQFKSGRSPFAAQFALIKKVAVSYEVHQGGTLKLFLDEYNAPLIMDLVSLKILPKKIVEATGDDFYRKPIGTGPYQYSHRDIKNIFLQKNDKYFGKKGRTQTIQFKVIKDANTRFQKMYKGKIDIIQSDIPFSKVSFFRQQEKFRVVVAPGLSTTYILLNLRNPILQQKRVRHAISSAIDRDELIRYAREGFAEPATSIVTRANAFFNKELKYHHLNESQIRETFQSLGDNPIILKTSNTLEAIENGKVITQRLKSMGLNVEQQTYEWGTYYEDVRTGKFEMAIMKWVGVQDPDIYRTTLHSSMTPPGRNRGYYSNPEFDTLVIKGLKEPSFAKRKALYDLAQKIVFEDLPTIPLWYDKQVAVIHNRVKNYKLPLTGNFSALTEAYKDERE
jgi:peptide/nickel transport system substrate-binding protein